MLRSALLYWAVLVLWMRELVICIQQQSERVISESDQRILKSFSNGGNAISCILPNQDGTLFLYDPEQKTIINAHTGAITNTLKLSENGSVQRVLCGGQVLAFIYEDSSYSPSRKLYFSQYEGATLGTTKQNFTFLRSTSRWELGAVLSHPGQAGVLLLYNSITLNAEAMFDYNPMRGGFFDSRDTLSVEVPTVSLTNLVYWPQVSRWASTDQNNALVFLRMVTTTSPHSLSLETYQLGLGPIQQLESSSRGLLVVQSNRLSIYTFQEPTGPILTYTKEFFTEQLHQLTVYKASSTLEFLILLLGEAGKVSIWSLDALESEPINTFTRGDELDLFISQQNKIGAKLLTQSPAELQIVFLAESKVTGLLVPSISSFESRSVGCLDYISSSNCYFNCDSPAYFLHQALGQSLPGTCLKSEEIPPGFGISASKTHTQVCETNHCKDCREDYSVCLECFATYYLMYLGTQKCVSEPPIGFGIDLAAVKPQLQLCAVEGCYDCSSDHLTCRTCRPSYALNTITLKTCHKLTEIPTKLGLMRPFVDDFKSLVPCASVDCRDCSFDYRNCTRCDDAADPSLQTYLFESHCWTSTELAQLPPGIGKNLLNLTLDACKTTGCSDCLDDALKCKSCSQVGSDSFEQTLHLGTILIESITEQVCLPGKLIPSGQGAVLGSQTPSFALCEDPRCTNCTTNTKVCHQCLEDSYLFFSPQDLKEVCTSIQELKEMVPVPAFGLDARRIRFISCKDPQCLVCHDDHRKCLACQSSFKLLVSKSGEEVSCSENIHDGIGNSNATHLAYCSDPYCKDCRASFSECQACFESVFHYPSASEAYLICYPYQVPWLVLDGLGLNAISRTPLLPKCSSVEGPTELFGFQTIKQASDCSDCTADYLSCKVCKQNFYLVKNPLIETSLMCVTREQIPIGFGRNLSDPRSQEAGPLVQCHSSRCSDCRDDHEECFSCQTGFYLYLPSRTTSPCYNMTEIATLNTFVGFGIDEPSRQIQPCVDSINCLKCYSNRLSCEECKRQDFALHQKVESQTNECVLISSFSEPRLGLDTVKRAFTNCTDPRCHNCSSDYRICTVCEAPFYLLTLLNGSITCESWPNPALSNTKSLGLDLQDPNTKRSLKECTTALCDAAGCAADHNRCLNCSKGYLLFEDAANPQNNQCLASAPAGFGIDVLTQTTANRAVLRPCSADAFGCKLCPADHQRCEECVSGKKLNFSARTQANGVTCLDYPSTYAGFGLDPLDQRQLRPCSAKDCEDCAANSSRCVRCKSSPIYYLDEVSNPSNPVCRSILDLISLLKLGIDRQSDLVPKLRECQVLNCQKCQQDSNNCTECQTNFGLRVENNRGSQCVIVTDIEAGFGVDPAVQANGFVRPVQACNDAKCENCQGDVAVCSRCKIGSFIGTLGVCQDCSNNCQRCKSNRVCDICSSELGIYALRIPDPPQDALEVSCINITFETPTGYGRNQSSTSSFLYPCNVSECADCVSDNLVCSRCNPGYWLIKNSSGSQVCYPKSSSTPPPGYRFTDSTNISLEGCNVLSCLSCSSSSSVCEECSSSPPLYLSYDSKSCLSPFSIPIGFGIMKSASIARLQRCQVPYCLECKTDSNSCQTCQSQYFLEVDAQQQFHCILSTVPEEGYGLNPESNLIVPCASENCQLCASDYRVCQECYLGAYLLPSGVLPTRNYTARCIKLQDPDWPARHGIPAQVLMTELKSQTLRPCTDPACSDCSEDYQGCFVCPAGQLILKGNLKVQDLDFNLLVRRDLNRRPAVMCFATTASISPGLGIRNGSGLELEVCRTIGCRICSLNSSRCDECASGFYTDPRVAGACLSLQEAMNVPGFGLKPVGANSLLVPCGTPNCRNCSTTYAICTECNSGYLRWLTATTVMCLKPTDPIVVNSGKGANIKTGAFENCLPQYCRNCAADYSTCNQCLGVVFSLLTSPGQVTCFGSLEDLPDRKGLKKGSKTEIVACTDLNCQTCREDHSVCTACSGNQFYLVNGSCITRDSIYQSLAEGEGLALEVPPNFKLKCQAANCKICKEDFRNCEGCAPGFLYLEGDCIEPVNTPVGYGLDPSLGQLLPCATPGCDKCRFNRFVCQECSQQIAIQVEDAVGAIQRCMQVIDESLDGYGPLSNLVVVGKPQRLRPCLDSSNCETCGDIYTKCTQCKPGYLRQPETLSCSLITPSMPLNTGLSLWPTPPSGVMCSSSSCQICPFFPANCLKCAAGFTLHALSGRCLSQATVDGKGVATDSEGTLLLCKTPYCKRCSPDGLKCLECYSGFALLITNSISGESGSCLDFPKFPPKMGLSLDKKQVAPCSVPNCKVCTSDASKCEFCQPGFYSTRIVSLSSNQTESCLSLDTIPPGQGLNLSTLTVSRCLDEQCISCTLNSSTCLKCKDGYTLDFLDTQTCQLINNLNLSSIEPTKFQNSTEIQRTPPSGATHGISEAIFSVDMSFFDQDDVVFIPYMPKTGQVIPKMTLKSHRLVSNNKGLRFEFSFPSSVTGASVLIRSLQPNQSTPVARLTRQLGLKRMLSVGESEAEETNPFDTGVLLSDVSYYKFELQQTTRTLSLVVAIIMIVMAYVILCVDTPLGFRIAEVMMIIRLFAFWNGDTPKVLTECLYWFRINPFAIIPFWKVDEDILSCSGPSILSITETDCLIYNNLSRFIPTVLAIITLRALGSWILSVIKSWRSPPSVSNLSGQQQEALPMHSAKVFEDFKLIAAQMWLHTIIPITFFSWINIYSSNTTTGMKIGFFFSGLFLVAYLLTILYGFWCIQDFKGKSTLEEWKQTHTLKYLFVYELELTTDRALHRFTNYARPLELLKHHLLATLVAVLVEQPLSLGFSVVFLQALHLGFQLVCRPYTTDTLRLQFVTAQEVIFTLMSCLLLATYPKLAALQTDTRETSLGVLLAAICPMFACITCLLLGTYLPLMRRHPTINTVRPKENKTE